MSASAEMQTVGRTALLACGAIGGALAVGALTEVLLEARDRRHFPPQGRLVDVGGYRLHLRERGSGTPTVLLDAGLAGFSQEWELVARELEPLARVITYDRAGYGYSDPGPSPRTASVLAAELAALLRSAGIEGPYILVGHSFAGYILRIFAARSPQSVAGLVLVDASTEDLGYRLHADELRRLLSLDRFVKRLLRVAQVAATVGVIRWLGALGAVRVLSPFAQLPLPERERAFRWRYTPRFFATCAAEYRGFVESGELARAAGSLGDLPVIAISATGSDRPDGKTPGGGLMQRMTSLGAELQGETARRLSTRAQHVVTTESGHQVAITRPALVVAAVRELIEHAHAVEVPRQTPPRRDAGDGGRGAWESNPA